MGPEERRICISIVIRKKIAAFFEVPSEISWLELGGQIGTVRRILSKVVHSIHIIQP